LTDIPDYRYRQLERWLLEGLRQGRWGLGQRLPSIRTLCAQKHLSKATVQHALQRLEARGLLEARPRAGYIVKFVPETISPPRVVESVQEPRPVSVSDLFLDIMSRSAAFDVLPDPNKGEAAPGIVRLNRAIGRALRRHRGEGAQYYDIPAGDPGLREQLSVQLSRRGWAASPDDLCITSGCQHALFLALMATCAPGDVIAVESPGFYGVLQLLEQLKLRVVEVPSSTDTGMDMDALEEVLKRWSVRACVVSPAFSTPSGACMPEAARKRLLALADSYDLVVIEDDIYAETGMDEVPDTLKALDTSNRVIHCSSFSKILSRDLRLGWVAGARWHQSIIHLKLVTQLASTSYQQQGVGDFIRDGELQAHCRRLRGALRIQRDRLLSALHDWPCTVRTTIPAGGLSVWVELPEDCDTLAQYQYAMQQGVSITPGPLFSSSGHYRNCLRLSYAHPWNEARWNALNRIPELLGIV